MEAAGPSPVSRMYGEDDLLSGVHGHGRALWPNAEAKNKTRDEEVWPRVGYALPDAGKEREHSRDEDRSSPSEPFVELNRSSQDGRECRGRGKRHTGSVSQQPMRPQHS